MEQYICVPDGSNPVEMQRTEQMRKEELPVGKKKTQD